MIQPCPTASLILLFVSLKETAWPQLFRVSWTPDVTSPSPPPPPAHLQRADRQIVCADLTPPHIPPHPQSPEKSQEPSRKRNSHLKTHCHHNALHISPSLLLFDFCFFILQVMISSLIFTETYHLFWHLILSALYYPYLSFSLDMATHKINSLKYYWNLLPVLNAGVVKFYLNINYCSFKKKCTITLQPKYKKNCTFLLFESIKDHCSIFKGLLHCTILKNAVIIKHPV